MAHAFGRIRASCCVHLCLVIAMSTGCSGEPERASTVGDPVVETPDACAALPFRRQAEEALRDELEEEAGLSPVQVRYPYQGAPYYAPSLFDLAPIDERRSVALLLNGPEDFDKVESFRSDFEAFEVDWERESVVVLLAWPDQYVYRYALAGDQLVVHVGELQPCSDYPAEQVRLAYNAAPLVLALPKVSSVDIRSRAAQYRFSDVPAHGSCSGEPERVLDRVGSSPSLLEEEGRLRMWYAGFSANTGNVFTTSSSDGGRSWDPKGWSMDHLSRFADHSVYAQHFGASVMARDGGYWMFYDDTDFQFTGRAVLARASSADGIAWDGELALFGKGEPGSWNGGDVGAPHVLEHKGRYLMWYTGKPDDRRHGGAIGLALSDDGETWTQHAHNPVLAPGEPGTFDDLSVGSPAVRFDGERFVMLYWATTGGGDPSYPQHSSIGVATSADGIAWERSAAPLTTARADWAEGGLFSPDFVLHGSKLTAFVSGLDESAEPSIGRLECDVASLGPASAEP